MRVAIGSDHAGFPLKAGIIALLHQLGHSAEDLGTDSTDPVDYPDFSRAVATAVISGRCERGIVLCGSGVGASIAAAKVPGVRAAMCHDTFSARQGVEDDDMNVISLGARVIGPELAKSIVDTWLASEFDPKGTSAANVEAINRLDGTG